MANTVLREIQYRQIDFLRLFRLGKEKGYFKRKRKMPIDYPNSKDDAIKCCRRLLRDFIAKTFPKNEGFLVSSEIPKFIIDCHQTGIRNIYHYFSHYRETILLLDGGKEVLEKFNELTASRDCFLNLDQSYVNCGHNNLYVYPSPTHSNSQRSFRPIQELYPCAKEVLEYRKIWLENFPSVKNFFDIKDILVQKLKKKQKGHKKEEEKVCEELKRKNLEKKQQTQSAFDAVLARYIEQQGNEV
jgi:hypothetical protein